MTGKFFGIRRTVVSCAAFSMVTLGGCTSKVPPEAPISDVRDSALDRACASALTVRDFIEMINSGGAITPDLTAKLSERAAAFADAATASKNVDLRAAGLEASAQAKILNDTNRPEAERSAAYHPLINAVAQAFKVCSIAGVAMPGAAPNTGNMDRMSGM